jgi:hypothetical protein
LESLFHPQDNDIQMGGFTFRANPENVAVLQQLRSLSLSGENSEEQISLPLVLSLANNHTINGGYEGITTTQRYLDGNGISYVGAGTTPEEARELFFFDTVLGERGIQVCIQSYSYEGKENLKV